jgi:hypothetical protein
MQKKEKQNKTLVQMNAKECGKPAATRPVLPRRAGPASQTNEIVK